MTHRGHRETILLIILHVWILPSYGFTLVPHYANTFGHVATAHTTCISTLAAVTRTRSFSGVMKTKSQLKMSDDRRASYERFEDDYPSGSNDEQRPRSMGKEGDPANNNPGEARMPSNPPPYREEHSSGASRFRDLLARSRGMDSTITERMGEAAGPPQGTNIPPPPLQSPRPPPPRPDTYTNYDNSDSRIGSPDLPDLPLKNEMPGMKMPHEMGSEDDGARKEDGGGGGGGRFRHMMNQAMVNDERMAMGGGASTRPSGGDGRKPQAPYITKQEKERALREAVDRQQKLMAKARGIDLDDPTLEGAELARKKAISRAQAEAAAGGYVPSSSAADDYIDALKVDSRRRTAVMQNKLNGRDVPPENQEPVNVPEPYAPPTKPETEYVPQRRTAASLSIQNESDAYIAALSGIEVDIQKNPYMEKDRSMIEDESLRPPSSSPVPTGPTTSYSEQLRQARETKLTSSTTSSTFAAEPSTPQLEPQAAQSPALGSVPQTESTPSYAARLRQAREGNAAGVAAAAPSAPSASASGTPIPRQDESGTLFSGDDEDPQEKIMKVMDLLTEHKTSGLVGGERVGELRKALIDAKEALKAETYGRSTPFAAPQESYIKEPQQAVQRASPTLSSGIPLTGPQASATATHSAIELDIFKRCNALLAAHIHSSVAGKDLEALREGLVASLRIVNTHLGDVNPPDSASPAVASSPNTYTVSRDEQQEERLADNSEEGFPMPVGVEGMHTVGSVLSEMGMDRKPEKFEPEDESSAASTMPKETKNWVDVSLGGYEKGIATKALGYLLKHRGGKGYGRGRVKGVEAESMISTLAELIEILQEEMVEL